MDAGSGAASPQDDTFEALLREAARGSAPEAPGSVRLLSAGTLLCGGRLSIVKKVGEGGMGVVYEAFDAQRKQLVALKTLSRLDAGSVYRLKNEFRALAEMRHDHLVRLHELFNDQALWCFTMELVDGERFDDWVRPRTLDELPGGCGLDEPRLRAALPQLVQAVGAIHAAGKLHRDLKPSNVLVTPEGRVVVLDFGLAVDPELGGVGQTVADQSVSGTPAYMAPEQAASGAATRASDFYALGVMLFEALTGRLPFVGRSGEMLAAKQTQEAPSVRALNSAAPADLAALCAALLAREPTARPALESLIAQLPASAAPPSRATAERPSAQPREGTPELLGREPELAALHDAFSATLEGQSVVLFVSGESGMGKSALCEAFLDGLRSQGRATVLAGRCYERENVPFKGFDSLVDDLSRHLRRLSEREAAALLPRDVHALVQLFPALGRVGVVAEAPQRAVTDRHEVQRRAYDAFGELMARLRDRQPLVLFIDDLQWTDQDSVRFMRSLLLNPEPVPGLLLCAHRSEGAELNTMLGAIREAALDNRAVSLRPLPVGPLPRVARLSLARRLLGDLLAEDLARVVADESGGSPFFAHELAHAVRHGGGTGLSLQEAIHAHLATLGAGARRVLQALAVAGQPLPLSVVVDAVSLPEGYVALDALRSERLVRVSGAADSEREVECYHDKIRECMISDLPALLLRELSAGLARALSDWAGADPELLTRCLEDAGATEAAGQHAATAADAALAGFAADRAARLYDKALALAHFDPSRLHALKLSRAHALAHAGRGLIAAEAYLLARDGTRGHEHAELSRLAAEQLMICGRLDRGREVMAEAVRPLGIVMPQSLPALLTTLVYQRGRLRMRGLRLGTRPVANERTARRLQALGMLTHAMLRSDQARAAIYSAQWVREALDAGDELEAARALGWEVLLATSVTGNDEYLWGAIERAQVLCERIGDPEALANLCFGRGFARIMIGALDEGLGDFDRAVDLYRLHPELRGASYNRPWLDWFRGAALCQLGRLREVTDALPSLIERAWARSELTLLPFLAGGEFALANIAAGRMNETKRELDRVDAAWQSSEFLYQDSQLAGGRVYWHLYRGDIDAAWATAEVQSRKLRASALGMTAVSKLDWVVLTALPSRVMALPEGSERRALVSRWARATAQWARLEKRGPLFRPSDLLRATLASMQHDQEAAIAGLRRLIEATPSGAPRTPPLVHTCTSRRLGELLGGDEGRALVAKADSFLVSAGVVEPARFVAVFVPGFEAR